jgi:two-component system chemotaxis response regulator CheB
VRHLFPGMIDFSPPAPHLAQIDLATGPARSRRPIRRPGGSPARFPPFRDAFRRPCWPVRSPDDLLRADTRQDHRPAAADDVDGAETTSLPVVALVASAGGLDALSEVLSALPAGFPAAVLVLQHLESGRVSRLPEILAARTPLRVQAATHGVPLRAGTAYVAPPGRHLAITERRTLALTDTAKVHYSRPSADVLLDSLAVAGAPVIAVVLTGRGKDGAGGCLRVCRGGGTVLAQDQATSLHFGMPDAAARAGGVSEVLPLQAIAPRLVQLVHEVSHG